jgi:hypothetical protein
LLQGYSDQMMPLDQRGEALGCGGSDGISQRQVLQHLGIAGLDGTAAECKSRLPAARGEKHGGHWGGTVKNPTLTGWPQRHDKDVPQGCMA